MTSLEHTWKSKRPYNLAYYYTDLDKLQDKSSRLTHDCCPQENPETAPWIAGKIEASPVCQHQHRKGGSLILLVGSTKSWVHVVFSFCHLPVPGSQDTPFDLGSQMTCSQQMYGVTFPVSQLHQELFHRNPLTDQITLSHHTLPNKHTHTLQTFVSPSLYSEAKSWLRLSESL